MSTNVDNIITDALELIDKEDFNGAKEILKDALELDKSNAEIYRNIGLCEINLDNNNEAISSFQKACEINNEDAVSLYYLACCLSKQNKEQASGYFKKVIELRKEYLDAYKSLAMMYIEMGQINSALNIALDAIQNCEVDYSILYMIATCYMLKKDYNNATKYLEDALKYNQNYLPILNSLATCYMNNENYEKAMDILQKAYQLDSKNSLTSYNLGICYQVKNEFKEALKYFQEAYNLEPSTTMLSSIAFCALKSSDGALASSLYQNLISAYPNNLEYRYSYIEALELLEDYSKALENVNILLSYDEKNISLIKKKGTYLRKLEKNEESIEVFQTLINRGKIDVEVYYNLAFNYTALSDWDNAKEMFKKCIILEPDNPYAHKDLGVLYLKMNCYDWALDEMKEAIKIEEDVSEFHYSLGVTYMMLSEIEKAKKAFLRAIELDNKNADAMAYLGYVYMLDRDFENANKILKEAIKIEPENFLAKSHIAKLYFQQQKYKTAKEFLSDIVEKTQDDETLNMLGICHMELQEYDKAIGILHNLAHKYPQNHILLTNLAKCEAKCDHKKEALEHIRQALMVYEDYEDALNLLKELEND